MKYIHLLCLGALLALASCGTKVPDSFIEDEHLPKIYPDYTDVTIPVNIAPLSFQLEQEADEVVTRFSYGDMELVCGGVKAQPSVDDWHQLTAAAQGHDITVEVFACNGGQWKRFKPFAYHVSADSIDAYLCYRLISPSYVTYEELTLNQRCLETYDEKVMVDNLLCSTEQDGQCVNCHNFQQYNPERMLFHARQNHGGTIMVYDGKVSKVNMRNDSLLSAGLLDLHDVMQEAFDWMDLYPHVFIDPSGEILSSESLGEDQEEREENLNVGEYFDNHFLLEYRYGTWEYGQCEIELEGRDTEYRFDWATVVQGKGDNIIEEKMPLWDYERNGLHYTQLDLDLINWELKELESAKDNPFFPENWDPLEGLDITVQSFTILRRRKFSPVFPDSMKMDISGRFSANGFLSVQNYLSNGE